MPIKKIKPVAGQKFKFRLNGKLMSVPAGTTVLEAARQKGIDIPALCHHPDFRPKGNCRVCVVEVKGRNRLATSCSTLVEEGMEVFTDSEKAKKARNMNIELIFAEHIEKCPACVWRFECPLLKMARDYKLLINHFPDRKSSMPTYKFANAVELDGSQCIDCRNCLDACSLMQNIHYLELKGKGRRQEVAPVKKRSHHCILCGQCAVHCPVSAAQEQVNYGPVEKAIQAEDKVVVAQIAPSIRVSIGENFGLPYGSVVTGHIVAALKKLGFDHVFDVNFGADLTTIIEAEELLERISTNQPLPMFTSCCPGWVNYAEFYHSELIPNLTTARSPQIHNGGAIKTYWAQKLKIDPARVIVVSIMPCTAKKYEASRQEMFIDGLPPVDHVLTTRELSFLIKKNNIDFANLKPENADDPLGEYTGGAAIFGASGGVMESALRSAHLLACGDKKSGVCRQKIDFKEARGLEGVREAEVEVAGQKLRIAVVSGIGNIEPVIDNLLNYHYIEVMACPGGCIGGGGQPIPTTWEIRQKRAGALYSHDKDLKLRISAQNKAAMEVVRWWKQKGYQHKTMHTGYKQVLGY